ncbi:hypothetical protein EJB05_12808, partial [Eragrostis curvula]
MALANAAQLGVADAIHRGGGEVSLDSLLAALSLPPSKLPCLGRVMRVLTASGIFAVADGGGGGYRLTPNADFLSIARAPILIQRLPCFTAVAAASRLLPH